MDEDLPSSSNAQDHDGDGKPQQERQRERLARRRRRQDRPAPTLSSVAPGFACGPRPSPSAASPPSSSAPTGPLAAWLRSAIGDDLSPSEALAWPVPFSGRASPRRASSFASPSPLRPASLAGASRPATPRCPPELIARRCPR